MIDWLTKAFTQYSVAWVVISTVVALVSGYVSSMLTYRYKRREIVDTALTDLAKQRQLQADLGEKERADRVRQQIMQWANPILGAVDDLEHRLKNILHQGGYVALTKSDTISAHPQWSVTYDYFMSSSLYHFAQYFAWVQMLREELSVELFQSRVKRNEFFEAIVEISRRLSEYPATFPCSGSDVQIFWLQQRAIGELLILREGERQRCMTYPTFLDKLNDPSFEQHLIPLKSLLQDVSSVPDGNCRWARLQATHRALLNLKTHSEQVLDLPQEVSNNR